VAHLCHVKKDRAIWPPARRAITCHDDLPTVRVGPLWPGRVPTSQQPTWAVEAIALEEEFEALFQSCAKQLKADELRTPLDPLDDFGLFLGRSRLSLQVVLYGSV
jgi:hypothetical protein